MVKFRARQFLASGSLAALLVAGPAQAATYLVTTTNDSGAGSLRDAITQANAAGGSHTIAFDSTVAGGTIALASALPVIVSSIRIVGAGATIDGLGANRIFFVGDGSTPVTVSFESLTLTRGQATGGAGGVGAVGGGTGGGGMGAGGALYIANNAAVTVVDVAMTQSSAAGGAGGSRVSLSGSATTGGGGGGLGGAGGSAHPGGGGGGGGGRLPVEAGRNGVSTIGGSGGGTGGDGGDRGTPGAFGRYGGGGGGNGAGGGGAGSGGFGGGGGGGTGAGAGGAGGFGGGGGGADSAAPGAGGFGGGAGVKLSGGSFGGGGAGFGGAVFVQEGGSLIFGGASSQVGGSVIGGTGGNAGLAGGSGLFLQGSGTLSFDPERYQDEQTVSGAIEDQVGFVNRTGYVPPASYTGAERWGLAKSGHGTLILSGANTYSGPTTISEGLLTIAAGGSITSNVTNHDGLDNHGTISGTVDNNGGFSNGTDGVVSGRVTSAGGVVNEGAFNGGATFTGGFLIGTGSVAGLTVGSGAMFMPGDTIPGSSMAVNGDLTLQAGAQYVVVLNPATSSWAAVTGIAALNGAAATAAYDIGSYVAKRYTILTATGGIDGKFGLLENLGLPTNFTASLDYGANAVFLDLALAFVLPGGLNQNQQSVVTALEGYFDRTGGIPAAFASLGAHGLTLASGEVATAAPQAAFDAQGQFLNALTDPFLGGASSAPVPGSSVMSYAALEAQSHGARQVASVLGGRPLADPFAARWQLFGTTYGGIAQTDGHAATGSHQLTSRAFGVVAGADYRLALETRLGFALGGAGTSFGLANGLGSGHSDLFQAGLHARQGFAGAGYLAGALAYGWNDVSTTRSDPSTTERLRGQYKANILSGRLEAGWRIDTGFAGVTPFAAAQVISYRLPSYAERGAGGAGSFALNYAGRDVTTTRSELGLRLDHTMPVADAQLTLRGRAAWLHYFETGRALSASFQALPGAGFVVTGAAQARDAALFSAGAELAWRSGFAVTAGLEGELSRTTSGITGKGGLKYSW